MAHNKYNSLLSFARFFVRSIKFVKCAMSINSAAILCVKIAWSHSSKRLVPRTDAYKMAATTVLVLWLMQVICHVGNTTIFFRKIYIFVPVWVIHRAIDLRPS